MASRRVPPTAVPVDLTEVAKLLRTAADQIRLDALARYQVEMERAAALDAAAGQAERAPAAPPAEAMSLLTQATTEPARPAPTKKAAAKRAPAKNAAGGKAPTEKAVVAAVPGEGTLMDRVVAVVSGTPSRTWTAAQVAEAVSGRPGTVSTFLARAAARGLIARAERGAYRSI